VKQIGDFGKLDDGQAVRQFELDGGGGCVARVLALGGIITQLHVPDRAGKSTNITLGLPDVKSYLDKTNPYFGALVGRFANRIGYGKFTLDGKAYQLPANDGPHSLHGGTEGYDKVLWTPEIVGDALKLAYTDAAGRNGYPGTVKVVVTYRFKDAVLGIDYEATTDAPTPINLTNHAYFNLRDGGASDILSHELRVFASTYTPSDDKLIPTGGFAPVAGTPFDYRTAKPIGRDFAKLTNTPRGVDHNFVLEGAPGTLRPAAEVYEPTTGRTILMTTTEPAVQVYTGNFLNGVNVGPDGAVYRQHHGLCLEAQHYPDSPNQPNFPNTILRPGQTYRQTTEYSFGVR
jgi:aldose 1-epimerase